MTAQAADALMSIFGFERVALRGDDVSGTTAAHELEVVMSEKMREDFEVWAVENEGHGMLLDFTVGAKGEYRSACERSAWAAWQASRAALVVELPAMTNDGYDGFYPAYGVKKAIHAAGVKTK